MSASNSTPDRGESASEEQSREQIARKRILQAELQALADRLHGTASGVWDDQYSAEETLDRLEEARAELAVLEELVSDE